MDHNLILTYDIGTTGNKCTVFNSLGQEVMASIVPYETIFPKPGWAEQDPQDFWQSVITGTRQLIEKGLNPAQVAVIGISGHMNGCIPLDEDGRVLYHNIIHSDSRTRPQCQFIEERIDFHSFYNITGNRLDPHYTLPKVIWLKEHHPDIYKRTRYFVNSKDYISYCLTGRLGITDYSDASLTCMLDLTKRDWAYDLLQTLDIDQKKLPELHCSHEVAGGLTRQAADLLGLKEGTPVTVGGGDGACATRGSGVKDLGDAYNYFGSSAWIATLNEHPVLDKTARTFNFFDLNGRDTVACGTIQSAAASYNWAVEMLGSGSENPLEGGEHLGQSIYDKMESMARSSPVGANGLFFLPYLMGERTPLWDPNTRGAFVGFTLYHSRNDMIRSVYEGIAYALRTVLDVFRENKVSFHDMILIGGGAKSRLWNEMLCNVFNMPVRVHQSPGVATSLGAAIAAGIGVGIFKDFTSSVQPDFARQYQPDEKQHDEYLKYYTVYSSMYPQLKPLYQEIANL
ncbi:MAG: xylulokinase [Caldicoprobacterales bacterium]|jgi:xylulokinase